MEITYSAYLMWGCSLTKMTSIVIVPTIPLWDCSKTMIAHAFQTIQKEHPHARVRDKIIYAKNSFLLKICLKLAIFGLTWVFFTFKETLFLKCTFL